MTCEACHGQTLKLIAHDEQLWCPPCVDAQRSESRRSTSVISDEIPGGFLQENFGHTPEMFYSKRAMARRASELGLQPMVRHVDGDRHVSRWV